MSSEFFLRQRAGQKGNPTPSLSAILLWVCGGGGDRQELMLQQAAVATVEAAGGSFLQLTIIIVFVSL